MTHVPSIIHKIPFVGKITKAGMAGLLVLGLIFFMFLSSNLFMYYLVTRTNISGVRPAESEAPITNTKKSDELYLLNQASVYIYDIDAFEKKVKTVSRKLNVPPEWLMAVMYSESKFDASITNVKGSGATGLIQWMPQTAREFGITVEKLRNLNHVEQLDFAYKYLQKVKEVRKCDYKDLTQFYLAILHPKAIGQEDCYPLYSKPSEDYKMNAILDSNKDGRVTVKDIDKRMERMFPTAYNISKPKSFFAKLAFWNWFR